MIQTAITISLIEQTRNGGPFVFHDDLAAGCQSAARFGFDAVEVFPPNAAFAGHSELPRLVESLGLRVAAVGTGAGWLLRKLTLSSPDRQIREDAIGFVKGIIDVAATLKAPAIIGSMQGRAEQPGEREASLGYLAESVAVLADHAAAYKVPLLVEPLNRYETNLLNTLSDGAKLIARSGKDNVKMLADLFHMNIEEPRIEESLRSHGSQIGHIHLADSNRRAAGFGHTNFVPIAAALKTIKYDGCLSAEVLPLPDPGKAAEQTLHAYNHFFRS